MSPPSKTACKDGADPIQVPSVILEDEDAESGNGPSLPMSPRSVEAIPAATASSETRGGVTPVKQVLYQALFLCNICVVFRPVLPFEDLLFIQTSTNATNYHKYSPLPSEDFDSSEVLVSFCAFIFS